MFLIFMVRMNIQWILGCGRDHWNESCGFSFIIILWFNVISCNQKWLDKVVGMHKCAFFWKIRGVVGKGVILLIELLVKRCYLGEN